MPMGHNSLRPGRDKSRPYTDGRTFDVAALIHQKPSTPGHRGGVNSSKTPTRRSRNQNDISCERMRTPAGSAQIERNLTGNGISTRLGATSLPTALADGQTICPNDRSARRVVSRRLSRRFFKARQSAKIVA